MNRQRLTAILDTWFGSGYWFLLPYAVVFWRALSNDVQTAHLDKIFDFFHVLTVAGFVLWAVLRRSLPTFWVLILIGLAHSGAFFEFPSDVWEHVRRTTLWNHAETLSGNPFWTKFAYFWNWTILKHFAIDNYRNVFDVLSTFWQFLLLYQFSRVAELMGLRGISNRVAVVGVLCFFGHTGSTFRYYALSSTPIAYLGYLAVVGSLVEWIEAPKTWIRLVVVSAFGLLLISLNHRQEIVFVGVAMLAAFVVWGLRERSKVFLGVIAVLIAVGAFATVAPVSFLSVMPLSLIARLVGSIVYPLESYEVHLWHRAIYPLWQKTFMTDAIAFPGALAAIWSVRNARRYPWIAAMTLVPLALLVYAPFVLLFASVTPIGNTYRILYSFPQGIAAMLLIWEAAGVVANACQRWRFARTLGAIRVACVLCGIFLLLLPAKWPWRNRSFFQFYRPAADLNLAELDATAIWFEKKRPRENPSCPLIADDVTHFGLSALLGWNTYSGRTSRLSPMTKIDSLESFQKYTSENCVRGFLVPQAEAMTRGSIIGPMLHHWVADASSRTKGIEAFMVHSPEWMMKSGWVGTDVPPFYRLFERVDDGTTDR